MTTVLSLPLSGLASHLVREGFLGENQAFDALRTAEQLMMPFVSYLVKHHILSSEVIIECCQRIFSLPVFDLKDYQLDWFLDGALSIEQIERYHVLPLEERENTLRIGLSDPTDHAALDAITFHTGKRVSPVLLCEKQLHSFIENIRSRGRPIERSLLKKISLDDAPVSASSNTVRDSIQTETDGPLIQLVDQIIQRAILQSASDIHIEPYAARCRVRYRCDGLLYEITQVPFELAGRMVARLKVMARLDITERRVPQDGRFQLFDRDVRMSTCPTLFGEKVVLRLLDAAKISLPIDQIGFTALQQKMFIEKISRAQGMVLVTGPTGSGKTVTLYSALHYLNSTEKNISTVEDPVEIQLMGINQVSICSKVQLDFATALRALLRQDPDIIMIGEVRDQETAKIALQAANTGHLVLSTLHTNSAIETIARLQAMGIQPYQMAHAVTLVVAGRLVRKLCDLCKRPDEGALRPNTVFRAVGCHACLQGYRGRTGIYELLPFNEKTFKSYIEEGRLPEMTVLADSAMEKVFSGTTSLAEINRVLA